MKTQRSSFMEVLRDRILNDDITKKLVLHKNKEMPEIFKSELTKHEDTVKIIEQNLKAQENIVRAMTEINAKYAPTRKKVADLIEARNEKIRSLIDSFKAYENLLGKAKKAVEFYEKLNSNLQDLMKKVEKTMSENEKEKDAVIAKLATPKGNLPKKFPPQCEKLRNFLILKIYVIVAHIPTSVPSTRPTLKDYLNAGGGGQGFRPSAPAGVPFNPQPHGYPMPNAPHQPYNVPPQVRPPQQGYHPLQPGQHQPHPHPQQPQQYPVGYPPAGSYPGNYSQPGFGGQNPHTVPPPHTSQPAGGQNPYYAAAQQNNSSVNPNDMSLI